MILDTYDNGPLTAGWTCSHCGAELERAGSVDPRQAALPIT